MAVTLSYVVKKTERILKSTKAGFSTGIFSVKFDKESRMIRLFGDGLLLLKGVLTSKGNFEVVEPGHYHCAFYVGEKVSFHNLFDRLTNPNGNGK